MGIIRWILCKLSFHQLYVIQEISRNTRKVGYMNCAKTWGMNDEVRAFVPWDADLEDCRQMMMNEGIWKELK